MIRAAIVLLIGSASFAVAEPFSLLLPVDCTLGDTCYIQQYVDHDPGPGSRDFTCNGLSYDGHKGTDFALPTLAAMSRGVAVRAAAPGAVRAVRDGIEDRLHDGRDLGGLDCGNGMAITHADGWETQYCHLRQGSVLVQPGATVAAGTPLGQIGLSGRTQFPHLHLTLRHNGEVIDPFAPEADDRCGSDTSLWQTPLAYAPGGLVDIGFAGDVPRFEDVTQGTADRAPPRRDTALVGFGYAFGARRGDILWILIDGPTGEVTAHDSVIEKDQATVFRAAGRKMPPGGWPPGQYRLTVSLIRGDESLGTRSETLTLPAAP